MADEFGGIEVDEEETKEKYLMTPSNERYNFTPSEASKHYIDAVNETEKVYGLPENMLANLIQTESGYNPKAIGPKTKYGKAKGITQIITQFHPDVDPMDPYASIEYAGRKLKEYYEEFGDWDSAIASWNAGPTNLRKHGLEGIKRISAFKETQDYLAKINANRSNEPQQINALADDPSAEPPIEPEIDEFGGATEPPDEFGGQAWKDPKDPKWEKPLPRGQLLIDNYARPVLQGLGAATGLMIGGGAGGVGGTAVAPGPGTVVGAGAGGIAGEALGYAMGDEVADILQEWFGYYEPKPVMLNLQEAGANIREGAAFAMGGHALGPAAGATKRGLGKIPGVSRVGKFFGGLMPKTDKRAQMKAGEVLAAFTDKGPLVAKNIEEAQALEELIPGLKFDLGQLTGDVNVVKFMKEGVDDMGDLAVARAEQAAANTKAINEFIKKAKGPRGAKDALTPLRAARTISEQAKEIAEMNMAKQQASLESKVGPMEGGKAIRGEIEAGERIAREKASKLFDKVPEQDQIVDDIVDGFANILKPSHRTEGKDKFPKVLRDALKELKKGKPSKAADDIPDLRSLEEPMPGEAQTIFAYRVAKSGKFTPAQARAKADIFYKESQKLNKAGKAQEAMEASQKGSNWREVAETLEGAPQHKESYAKYLKDEGEEVVKEVTMSLKDIQGLRSEILEDLRTAKDKGYPRSYRNRLTKAVDLIDQKLGATSKIDKARASIAKAKKTAVHARSKRDNYLEQARAADNAEKFSKAKELRAMAEKWNKKLKLKEAKPSEAKPSEKAPSQQLQEAQKYFRENVIEKYGKGSVGRILRGEETVSDAMVADAFFKPGAKGEQAATEFMRVMGDNKKAKVAMKDHIDQKIFDLRSDKTDEITKAALSRFLKNHRLAINKLGLGKEYSSLAKARVAADNALAKSNEFNKSAASRALNADVNDLVKSAFSKGSKKEAAEGLIDTIRTTMKPFSKADSDRAVDGLRNAVVDEILTDIPLEGTSRKLLSSANMAKNFRKYDAALKVLFKDDPKKLKAMHMVRKAVKAMEYRTPEKAEVGEKYAADVIRRIAFLHGHTSVAAVDISRKAIRALRGVSKENIHKYVNRGILDPDAAYELIRIAKGGSEKKIAHGMNQSLVRLGLIAPQRKEDERKKH